MWVPWMQQVVFLAKPEELPSRSKQTGLREDDFGSGKSFKNIVLQNSVGKKKKKKRIKSHYMLCTCKPCRSNDFILKFTASKNNEEQSYMTVPWRKKGKKTKDNVLPTR